MFLYTFIMMKRMMRVAAVVMMLVLKVHVLVDLREKLFESIRPMANGQTDISTASRSGEDLSPKCVDRDDEPEVDMQTFCLGKISAKKGVKTPTPTTATTR